MLTSLSCTESIIHASAKPRQCLSSLQSSSGPASRARSAAPSSGEPAGGRQQRSGAPGGERRALARAPARAGALEPPAASVGKALGDPPEAGLQKAVAGEALPRRRLAAQLSASSRSSSLCLAAAAHKRGSGESAAGAPARRAAAGARRGRRGVHGRQHGRRGRAARAVARCGRQGCLRRQRAGRPRVGQVRGGAARRDLGDAEARDRGGAEQQRAPHVVVVRGGRWQPASGGPQYGSQAKCYHRRDCAFAAPPRCTTNKSKVNKHKAQSLVGLLCTRAEQLTGTSAVNVKVHTRDRVIEVECSRVRPHLLAIVQKELQDTLAGCRELRWPDG